MMCAAAQLPVQDAGGTRYYDLWHGGELTPRSGALAVDLRRITVLAQSSPLPAGAQWPELDRVSETNARALGKAAREFFA